MKEITNDWLETLAFYHQEGTPEHLRTLKTNGWLVETYDDGKGRIWWLNGNLANPKPLTQADVKALLRRIRR
jgi:hypothetical protein